MGNRIRHSKFESYEASPQDRDRTLQDIVREIRGEEYTPAANFVVIPGHGESNGRRTEVLSSIVLAYPPDDWDCIIFVYNNITIGTGRRFGHCIVAYRPGRWTHFMKLVTPEFVRANNYSYVSVHLNDVQWQQDFNISKYLQAMRKAGLAVSSPAVLGSPYLVMRPAMINDKKGVPTLRVPRSVIGWKTHFLEIQVTIFNSSAWSCFWNVVNPDLDPFGWGPGICFYNVCGQPPTGILPFAAVHWGGGAHLIGGTASLQQSPSGKIPGLRKHIGHYTAWLKGVTPLRNLEQGQERCVIDGFIEEIH